MGAGKPEKISRHERCQGYRKYLKLYTRRALRRLGKKDPENAPTRVRDITEGYS